MPKFTLFVDGEPDPDNDLDVILLVDGKEESRTKLEADDGNESHVFRFAARNQAFVIVPAGVAWPLEIVTEQVSGYRRQEKKGKKDG
jgi:hypothetical protein